MQRKKSFWQLLADKGYYIALGICALAVGISGWLFIRSLSPAQVKTAAPTEVQTLVLPTLPVFHNGRTPAEQEELPAAVLESIPKPGLTDGETPDPETEAPQSETEPAAPAAPARLETVYPVNGEISQCFAVDKLVYNSTTRDWRTHAGIDIAASEGCPVRAAAAGVVQAVYEDDLLGQTVTIAHAGGWVTHYANLAAEPAVFAGDEVAAGQQIGVVGHSALLEVGSEPHLHFSVYKNNVPQDPTAFLAQ